MVLSLRLINNHYNPEIPGVKLRFIGSLNPLILLITIRGKTDLFILKFGSIVGLAAHCALLKYPKTDLYPLRQITRNLCFGYSTSHGLQRTTTAAE